MFEEIVFRGMLLHRWNQKWGMTKAIIFSSFFFGIIHPDPLGAFVFGVAMSILYLRTQSLMIPILCHAANNLLVWFIEAGYRMVEGHTYQYTLEIFQDEWYIGVSCWILVILWSAIYFHKPSAYREWQLPKVTSKERQTNK